MVFNNNNFSDYGSGNSSSDSSMSFGGVDRWPAYQPSLESRQPKKSSSFIDLVRGRCTLQDVMQEFRMNGSDTPYTPVDDRVWNHRADDLIGFGPSSAYLRQKSWPEPERTPTVKLPRPASEWLPSTTALDFQLPPAPSSVPSPVDFTPAAAAPSPVEFMPVREVTPAMSPSNEEITEEQVRVLSSLPNNVLYSLLRELEKGRGEDKRVKTKRHPEECRFCKNNGERETYYRSHTLKDNAGRVRCPVLRAFVCARCGASGDHAHTIKYCPLSTSEERIKSAAMMRSVRMASGRRRAPPAHPDYVVFGEGSPAPAVVPAARDNDGYHRYGGAAPLDPLWAALEQKLML